MTQLNPLRWTVVKVGPSLDDIREVHTIPLNDDRLHLCDVDNCWCDPRKDSLQEIYFHNSADGRELYEEGYRKRH